MVEIYKGTEKHIHKILGKRARKELRINKNDIGFVSFSCSMPTENVPVWRVFVTIQTASDSIYQKIYYSDDCIKHGFKITWANLIKRG